MNMREASKEEKLEILGSMAEFSWCWDEHFLVRIENKLFLWSDPDHCGNNRFLELNIPFTQAVAKYSGATVRDKGCQIVRDYCGDNITIQLRN
jgi:hypothetical protein